MGDAVKITYGVLFIILDISFTIFGFMIFHLIPPLNLMIIAFPGIILIYIGYALLKRFMGGWDIIKATITAIVIGFLIYVLGLVIIIYLLYGLSM